MRSVDADKMVAGLAVGIVDEHRSQRDQPREK